MGEEPNARLVCGTTDVGLEVTKRHVQRATDAVHSIYAAADAYERFMAWEDPVATGVVFAGFVALCCFCDAEHAGAVPVLARGRTLCARAPRGGSGARRASVALDLVICGHLDTSVW